LEGHLLAVHQGRTLSAASTRSNLSRCVCINDNRDVPTTGVEWSLVAPFS